jgi:predicted amidohydrolase
MKVALAQVNSGCDKSANLARITDVTAAAHGAGARVVLFPEFAMYEKPAVDATFARAAEPITGDFATAVAALAAEHRVSIAAGIVEQNFDNPHKPFNTLAVWDQHGNLIGRHRKALLFDVGSFAESQYISAGDPDEVSIVAVDGTVVGLQTCYELRFPELSRAQASAGATVLAVLSSWVPGPHKIQQWTTLARARAIENLCHVCAVTQAAPVSTGHSLAVAPDGQVLAELDAAPEWVCVEIDHANSDRARKLDPRMLATREALARSHPAAFRQ